MLSGRHFAVIAILCSIAGPARAQISGSAGLPAYTAAGIVDAATQLVRPLAPNSIATLYGTNLAFQTYSVTPADLTNGTMPTSIGGVTVYVNNIPASLFFVSPGQINFLLPYTLATSNAAIVVVRQGASGPQVSIPLASAAPGLFQWNGNWPVAVHADGSLVSASAPATAGEIIILFAAGLGHTSPAITSGQIVTRATPLEALAQFQVLLNSTPLPASATLYAGLAPGFAGLYQVNLQLPASLPANPVVQLAVGGQSSPASVVLPTRPTP